LPFLLRKGAAPAHVQAVRSGASQVDVSGLRLIEKNHVDVFYNPKNPEFAILEQGMSSGIKFQIFCGSTFLLAGVVPPLCILLYKANMFFGTR
ncbi:hypothetical protein P4C99_04860, partial [Pontiellaceae bacterium B1224]|nr:hypothetical protein [Pontiellaceae bacterium B1224]